MVTPDHRRQAKVVNFGIVYGLSAFGLSQNLGIEPAEAKLFIANYFEKYKGVRAFIDKTLEEARRDLKVKTLHGRIRPIPDINSKNFAPTRLRRTHRSKHPAARHRRRPDQSSHDPNRCCAAGAQTEIKNDPPSPRRTSLRSPRKRSRSNAIAGPRTNGKSPRASRPATSGNGSRPELERPGLARVVLDPPVRTTAGRHRSLCVNSQPRACPAERGEASPRALTHEVVMIPVASQAGAYATLFPSIIRNRGA